jgi:hypothetical protein
MKHKTKKLANIGVVGINDGLNAEFSYTAMDIYDYVGVVDVARNREAYGKRKHNRGADKMDEFFDGLLSDLDGSMRYVINSVASQAQMESARKRFGSGIYFVGVRAPYRTRNNQTDESLLEMCDIVINGSLDPSFYVNVKRVLENSVRRY